MPNFTPDPSEDNPPVASSSSTATSGGETLNDRVGSDDDLVVLNAGDGKNLSKCNGANSNSSDSNDSTNLRHKKVIEKTMIWTELEACKRQVNQIGVSACGATALINVLQV